MLDTRCQMLDHDKITCMVEQISEKQFILGVGINDVNLDTAVEIVRKWLNGSEKHYIVTPNPEFVMAARDDEDFREILNQADLAIPDGVGLKLSRKIKNTTTGIDLMEALCQLATEKNFSVGLLGGSKRVAVKSAERLRLRYHSLKIIYAEEGPRVDKNGDQISSPPSNKYQNLKADMIFVAFGQIKQEKWIAKNLHKLPVKIAMGVGGAFDEISGRVPRVPRFIHRLGLKWLVRLILQPWRIKRQFQLLRFAYLLVTRKAK